MTVCDVCGQDIEHGQPFYWMRDGRKTHCRCCKIVNAAIAVTSPAVGVEVLSKITESPDE